MGGFVCGRIHRNSRKHLRDVGKKKQLRAILIFLITPTFAGYFYTKGTRKAAKISNKNSSFNWVHSIHMESMNASHFANLFTNSWQSSSTLSYQRITPHNSSIRSDEGLMLETSAFQTFHGGNSIFINSFAKAIFFFHSPTDAAPWIDFPNPFNKL